MTNRNGNTQRTQFEGNTLSFIWIVALLLIGAGALAALSYFGILNGRFFDEVNRVLFGLAGIAAIGVPFFCIAGGILLICISRRRTKARYFIILLLAFAAALGLLNTTGHLGDYPFMDYLVIYNQTNGVVQKDGFGAIFSTAHTLCGQYKTFGGSLGILACYHLWYYLGNTIATVLLVVLLLLLALLFVMLCPQRKNKQSEPNMQTKVSGGSWISRLFSGKKNKAAQTGMPANQPMQYNPNQPMLRPYYPQQMPQAVYPQGYPMQAQMNQAMIPQNMPYSPMPVSAANGWPVVQNGNLAGRMIPARNMQTVVPVTGVGQAVAAKAPVQPAADVAQTMPSDAALDAYKRPANAQTENTEPDIQQYFSNEPAVVEGYEQPSREQSSIRHRMLEKLGGRMRKTDAKNNAADDDATPSQKRNGDEQQSQIEKAEIIEQPSWYDEIRQGSDAETSDMHLFSPQTRQYEDYVSSADNIQSTPADTAEASISQQEMVSSAASDAENQQGSRLRKQKVKNETSAMKHFHADTDAYQKPDIRYLNLPKEQYENSTELDGEYSKRLEEMFKGFRLGVRVQHITHGPSITRFELSLMQPGINFSQISNKTTNIEIVLETEGAVSIERHIRGTNLFGIVVPNKHRRNVHLREILESPEMTDSSSPTLVALGMDIMGKARTCDISNLPHLLAAGTTGCGKSSCMNSIIVSLLYRATPAQVRLIMIDPKLVEFSMYSDIPHLLIPVVTDPQKASGALMWCVGEMEARYKLFSEAKVRTLDQYNALIPADQDPMPRIIIFIDEFADLMMTCPKDVEASVQRLGQMGRASGIHLVIATQRPDAKTITGAISTNINSRIAMRTSSAVDSRIILDENGAENLLGNGDMIFRGNGQEPVRLQGCYVTNEEIQRVTDFLRKNAKAEYNEDLIKSMEAAAVKDVLQSGESDGELDSLIEEAIEMALGDGCASASMLQRRLSIGYPRAGKIIDEMESLGIIGPAVRGNKPREVIITREEYEQNKEFLLANGR